MDAEHVTVDTQDRKITLQETVRSYAEKRDAAKAAWAAAGVTEVDDQIFVSI
jgi:osmotically-inducible protein OsmY